MLVVCEKMRSPFLLRIVITPDPLPSGRRLHCSHVVQHKAEHLVVIDEADFSSSHLLLNFFVLCTLLTSTPLIYFTTLNLMH